jgi:hypothetical protein
VAVALAFVFAVLGSPRAPTRERETEVEERAPGTEDAPLETLHAREPRGSRVRLRPLESTDARWVRHVGATTREPGADVPRPRWSKPRRGRAPPDDDAAA